VATEPDTRILRTRTPIDLGSAAARHLVTAQLVVLVAIPARLVFAPLGGAGTPAQILGVLMACWWFLTKVGGFPPREQTQPVQWAVLAFYASLLASYIAATTRPIPPIEVSAADRGMISGLAFAGMALACASAPSTLGQFDVLMRRLTWVGFTLALVGLLQFATGQQLVDHIQIPGLSANSDLAVMELRGSLTRPAGTATHPIEFGAVLTMILPVALHYALHDTHRRPLKRWLPVGAIALAVPVSISRSAIVSTVIVLVLLMPTWPRQTRIRGCVAIMGLATVLYVLVPGLIGTLIGLFTGISGDTSTKSRTDSFGLAMEFIQRASIWGRGFRTFLPSYRILDNQYLLSTIETGVVGVLAFGGLLATAVVTTVRARRRSRDMRTRSLAQSLTASVTAAACSFALYDAFSFAMAASLLFVVLGMSGALGRLVRSSNVDSAHLATDLEVGSTRQGCGRGQRPARAARWPRPRHGLSHRP